MYISTNLKYLRGKRGMTQVGLAEKLDKTSAAVSDYEKGKSTPPMEVAFRICELFNITLDDFARRDLQKEDILAQEGIMLEKDTAYKSKYSQAREQLQTLERLNKLMTQRLAELEREIREHAPALALRLGLEEEDIP